MMKRALAPCVLVLGGWVALLVACSGNAPSSPQDVPRMDVADVAEAATPDGADGGSVDVASDGPSDAREDLAGDVSDASPVDVAADVAPPVDAGRALTAGGFATLPEGPRTAGGRVLVRAGFEGVVRACVGARCLTGGLLP